MPHWTDDDMDCIARAAHEAVRALSHRTTGQAEPTYAALDNDRRAVCRAKARAALEVNVKCPAGLCELALYIAVCRAVSNALAEVAIRRDRPITPTPQGVA